MRIFTRAENNLIPANVAIIYKNFGETDPTDKDATKSVFSWNLIDEKDCFAGTYYINHRLPITEEFYQDCISALVHQINEFIKQQKEKEVKNGTAN